MKFEFTKSKKRLAGVLLYFSLSVFGASAAYAQNQPLLPPSADGSEDTAEILSVEQEIQTPEVQADPELTERERQEALAAEQKLQEAPKTISDLNELVPFSQVSVIQRKFLPKTERLQFFGGLLNTLNNPWYNIIGLDLRLSYHFTESWALEGHFNSLMKSETQSIKEIRSEHDVVTSNLISPKGFMGANIVWHPVYGKISLLNKRIVPFDLYFYLGGGSTSYDGGQQSSSGSFQVGTGQIFAINKSTAFRWDLNWNNFSAAPLKLDSSSNPAASSFNHINLTAGLSFFFPEAKYR